MFFEQIVFVRKILFLSHFVFLKLFKQYIIVYTKLDVKLS